MGVAPPAGEEAAAGLAFGEAAGFAAGRKPLKFCGLLSMFCAKLLTIFASFIEDSTSAALSNSCRCPIKVCLI